MNAPDQQRILDALARDLDNFRTAVRWTVEQLDIEMGVRQRHGGQCEQYAFDTTEKAHIGRRSREWTAVGQTEIE